MLTKKARSMISDILGPMMPDSSSVSFLQLGGGQAPPLNTTTAVPPPVDETPVAGEEGPAGGDMAFKRCSPDPPDCGLLHDKLSLLWGDYKDKVDELTMEMNKNAFMFEELKITLNDQI